MALITCPECQKQISNQANSCPHCGYILNSGLNEKQTQKRETKLGEIHKQTGSGILMVLVGIAAIVGGIWRISTNWPWNKSDTRNSRRDMPLLWKCRECSNEVHNCKMYSLQKGQFKIRLLFEGDWLSAHTLTAPTTITDAEDIPAPLYDYVVKWLQNKASASG